MILKKIYLSWRHGAGGRRYLVGILSRDFPTSNDISFTYRKPEVSDAEKNGFFNYPEFPNFDKEYRVNLKTALSLRLMPKSRLDRSDYLDFWEANNPEFDWFDELGFTQGKLATDTFEFLADFPKHYNGAGIKFVSNIASLTHLELPNEIVTVGDKLRFELDSDNDYDKDAVKLFKGDKHIGWVKRGHNYFFQKVSNSDVDIRVKSLEKNGKLKQIYYSVEVK